MVRSIRLYDYLSMTLLATVFGIGSAWATVEFKNREQDARLARMEAKLDLVVCRVAPQTLECGRQIAREP